jgi:hypothetical protein
LRLSAVRGCCLEWCQKLKYVAIDMPPTKLGSSISLGKDFRLGSDSFPVAHVPIEFKAILVRSLLDISAIIVRLIHCRAYLRTVTLSTHCEY